MAQAGSTEKGADKKATRAKPRIGGAVKLASKARHLTSRAIRAKGFAEAEIVSRWASIVGAELAQATLPVRLSFPRGKRVGATLFVRAESAFAPLLLHRTGQVIERVNSYFGYYAVEKLSVQQGPLPAPKRQADKQKRPLEATTAADLAALVGGSDDEALSPLRRALKSLGEYVLSNREQGK